MRARELMTSPAVTLAPDTPISEAGTLLLRRGFSAVPVVDDERRLVGIVSESDLLPGRVGPDPTAHLRPLPADQTEPPHTVADVMTHKVVALPETADQADLAAAMLEHKVKSIPVVAGDKVVGIVAASDLLRTYTRPDADIARDVRARLREYAGGLDLVPVTVEDGVVILGGGMAEQHRRIAVLLAETVPGAVRVRTMGAGSRAPTAVPDTGEVRSEEPVDHRGLRVLSLDECVARLRMAPIGRLTFIHDGEPQVLPVNHGLDGLDVVFRTTWGSKLLVLEQASPVAFEVDGIDEDRETGWSVVVKGTASVVYQSTEAERLDELGVRSWAMLVDEAFWVRIRAEEITGREITGRAARPGSRAPTG